MSEKELEEGMYYEEIFCPVKAKLEEDEQGRQTLTLIDKNGEEMVIHGKFLISLVCFYLRKYTGLKTLGEITSLEVEEKEKVMNQALQNAIKKRKPVELKFLFDPKTGKLCSITSTLHKQVSWRTIRQIVERVIEKHFGKVEVQPFGTARWSYRLPIKNEYVSAWVTVDAGNNLALGRSGIKIFSRFRTEKGFGGHPPCLNWAQLWQVPTQFFQVDLKRLTSPIEIIGAENVKNLNVREVHMRSAITNMKTVERELEEGIINLARAVKAIYPVINKSLKVKLSKNEMKALLDAYDIKVGLPKYIKKQIMEAVQEYTVWGFSQAISYVRTHGEFRETKRSKPLDDRDLIHKLENISAEIMSLAPTIEDFHKKVGAITLERLFPKGIPGREQAKITTSS